MLKLLAIYYLRKLLTNERAGVREGWSTCDGDGKIDKVRQKYDDDGVCREKQSPFPRYDAQ
jgi:hypothetical protein